MKIEKDTGTARAEAATGKEREQGKYNDNNLARQGFSKAQIEAARRRLPGLDEVAGENLDDKSSKKEHHGPCLKCGGTDRFFWDVGSTRGYCRICKQTSDTIDAEMNRTGKTFKEVVKDALNLPEPRQKPSARPKDTKADEAKKAKKAGGTWAKAGPDDGTIKEYFTSRGLHLDAVPDCLRVAPSDNPKCGVKMIVARVSSPGEEQTVAVHRTYLDAEGKRTEKRMFGPCRGRGVWLAPPAPEIIVGEGIETTLAAMVAMGIPGVAALSTSGMQTIEIPDTVKKVHILVDEDENRAGQKAAIALAERLEREGAK